MGQDASGRVRRVMRGWAPHSPCLCMDTPKLLFPRSCFFFLVTAVHGVP